MQSRICQDNTWLNLKIVWIKMRFLLNGVPSMMKIANLWTKDSLPTLFDWLKWTHFCKITLLNLRTKKSIINDLALFRIPPPPTSFPPVTSTDVEISAQNFLTFIFNPFTTLVWSLKVITSASPKLLNSN